MSKSSKIILRVLLIVSVCLVLLALIRTINGGTPVTFSGFLEYVSNCPNITSRAWLDYTIYADWGVFNFLRDFLNIFTSLFSVLLYVFANLVQIVLYVGYFVSFIFVG